MRTESVFPDSNTTRGQMGGSYHPAMIGAGGRPFTANSRFYNPWPASLPYFTYSQRVRGLGHHSPAAALHRGPTIGDARTRSVSSPGRSERIQLTPGPLLHRCLAVRNLSQVHPEDEGTLGSREVCGWNHYCPDSQTCAPYGGGFLIRHFSRRVALQPTNHRKQSQHGHCGRGHHRVTYCGGMWVSLIISGPSGSCRKSSIQRSANRDGV